MELPAVPADAAANSSLQLQVSPGTDPGLRMRGDIACPQRAKRLPANWRTAASVGSMAQSTTYRVKIMAALHHPDALGCHAAHVGRDVSSVEGLHEWIGGHAGDRRPSCQEVQ